MNTPADLGLPWNQSKELPQTVEDRGGRLVFCAVTPEQARFILSAIGQRDELLSRSKLLCESFKDSSLSSKRNQLLAELKVTIREIEESAQ